MGKVNPFIIVDVESLSIGASENTQRHPLRTTVRTSLLYHVHNTQSGWYNYHRMGGS